MELIPFENLESIPLYHSRDYNYQVCKYPTDITNTLPCIVEETRFPSFQDIMGAVCVQKKVPPQTKVEYTVFDRWSSVEPECLPDNESYNPEPFYDDDTEGQIFLVYKIFTSPEDAYNHIKINFENGKYKEL